MSIVKHSVIEVIVYSISDYKTDFFKKAEDNQDSFTFSGIQIRIESSDAILLSIIGVGESAEGEQETEHKSYLEGSHCKKEKVRDN